MVHVFLFVVNMGLLSTIFGLF